jgi:hypothetical protein
MDPRHLSEDFRDFLKCLNDAGVEYLDVLKNNKRASGRNKDLADLDNLP